MIGYTFHFKQGEYAMIKDYDNIALFRTKQMYYSFAYRRDRNRYNVIYN